MASVIRNQKESGCAAVSSGGRTPCINANKLANYRCAHIGVHTAQFLPNCTARRFLDSGADVLLRRGVARGASHLGLCAPSAIKLLVLPLLIPGN